MSSLPAFLPWQLDTARQWLGSRDRFAHAWLLYGMPGIGKTAFALAGAASLLCEQPRQGLACGQCAACGWVASGNHPDLRRVRPDAVAQAEGEQEGAEDTATAESGKTASKDIRIEQVRRLSTWFNTATHRGGWRVAVIYPAQAMNHVTANALLKVLEEPPEHTLFLLVADAPAQLLPTLVSRCRLLPVPVPGAAQSRQWLQEQGVDRAEEWLALAGGAPLRARDQAQQGGEPGPSWLAALLQRLGAPDAAIGDVADNLEKTPPEQWIDTLQRLSVDICLAVAGLQVRYFPGLSSRIEAIAANAQPAALHEWQQWLTRQRAVAGHPLNARMFVHTALQRTVLACAARRAA